MAAGIPAIHHPGNLRHHVLQRAAQAQFQFFPMFLRELKLRDAGTIRHQNGLIRSGGFPTNAPRLGKTQIPPRNAAVR